MTYPLALSLALSLNPTEFVFSEIERDDIIHVDCTGWNDDVAVSLSLTSSVRGDTSLDSLTDVAVSLTLPLTCVDQKDAPSTIAIPPSLSLSPSLSRLFLPVSIRLTIASLSLSTSPLSLTLPSPAYPPSPPLSLSFGHSIQTLIQSKKQTQHKCWGAIRVDPDGQTELTSSICTAQTTRHTPPPTTTLPTLLVGTFNIWNVNNWTVARRRALATQLVQVDVALLQEVRFDWRSMTSRHVANDRARRQRHLPFLADGPTLPKRNQLTHLLPYLREAAPHLHFDFLYQPCMLYLHGLPSYFDVEGLAVLARRGILQPVSSQLLSHTLFLTRDPTDEEDGHQRCLQTVHTRDPPLSLSHSHWSLSQRARRRGAEETAAFLRQELERGQRGIVLAGDLNAEPGDPSLRPVTELLTPSHSMLTFPVPKMTKKIDWMLAGGDATCERCERRGGARYSDHYFIVCHCSVAPPANATTNDAAAQDQHDRPEL